MFDWLLIFAVLMPLLAVQWASWRACRGMSGLAPETRAQRCYRFSWLTGVLGLMQFLLPVLLLANWSDEMPHTVAAFDSALALSASLVPWIGRGGATAVDLVVIFGVLIANALFMQMAALRVNRLAKGDAGGVRQGHLRATRAMLASLVAPVLWAVVVNFIPKSAFDDPLSISLIVLAFVGLQFVLAPWLVALAAPCESLAGTEIGRDTRLMCEAADVRIGGVYLLRYGELKVANALVCGLLPWFRRVYVTDRMLETFSPAEVRAVIGHELGHVKHGHLWWYLGFALIGALALAPLSNRLAALLGNSHHLEILFGLMMLYWSVAFSYFSRRFERQADRFAVALTGDRDAFARALEKLAEVNCMTKKWSRWDIFQRHPDVAQRVQAL
jgi:Zn-dependent protease with chaperone function